MNHAELVQHYQKQGDISMRETLTRRIGMFDLHKVLDFIHARYKKRAFGVLTHDQEADFLACTHNGKLEQPPEDQPKEIDMTSHLRR